MTEVELLYDGTGWQGSGVQVPPPAQRGVNRATISRLFRGERSTWLLAR